jgi:hypothetical protein
LAWRGRGSHPPSRSRSLPFGFDDRSFAAQVQKDQQE